MSFGTPLLLLALLAVPATIGLYVLSQRRRARYAVAFTNLSVLASVVGGRSWRRYVPLVLFLVALTALCTAVARPRVKSLVANDQATVVLVLDVSGSMHADDVKPTRLIAAQTAIRTFLDRVPRRVRVGLVVFAGEAQVATPPTTDRQLVRQALDEADFLNASRGTAIGDALALAVDVGQQAVGNPTSAPPGVIVYRPPAGQTGTRSFASSTSFAAASTNGLVSILFLSDGHQTRGDLLPLEGAQRAKDAKIPVFTVALGTPNGTLDRSQAGGGGGFFGGGPDRIPVPPDPATLRAIAQTTGGQFFPARDAKALGSAYQKLGSRLGRTPGEREVTNLFLAAAAAALLAAGALSVLWSPRLP
ncbi:MAG: Ca-activated chloride channel [Gaiellaceae bacterium]|jgi:Ca-activated chloride channel family protein|nr:Ca-activated chloride channel [Gaiellaceae bacterium]MDX6508554.1 Ca-activated chloride channel [Gaiellaceae bacterium]